MARNPFTRARAAALRYTQGVDTYGPEPIGASQVDAILNLNGALLAGGGGNIAGWGLAGSQEVTDQHVYSPPQQFIGMAGGVGAAPYTQYEVPGLPSTVVPAGLVGFPDFPVY